MVLLALLTDLSTCLNNFSEVSICISRCLSSSVSSSCTGLLSLPYCTYCRTLHLFASKESCHLSDQTHILLSPLYYFVFDEVFFVPFCHDTYDALHVNVISVHISLFKSPMYYDLIVFHYSQLLTNLILICICHLCICDLTKMLFCCT